MTAELEWLYSTCTSKDKIFLAAIISHSSKLRTWKSLNIRGWKNVQGKSTRSTEQLWKKIYLRNLIYSNMIAFYIAM